MVHLYSIFTESADEKDIHFWLKNLFYQALCRQFQLNEIFSYILILNLQWSLIIICFLQLLFDNSKTLNLQTCIEFFNFVIRNTLKSIQKCKESFLNLEKFYRHHYPAFIHSSIFIEHLRISCLIMGICNNITLANIGSFDTYS